MERDRINFATIRYFLFPLPSFLIKWSKQEKKKNMPILGDSFQSDGRHSVNLCSFIQYRLEMVNQLTRTAGNVLKQRREKHLTRVKLHRNLLFVLVAFQIRYYPWHMSLQRTTNSSEWQTTRRRQRKITKDYIYKRKRPPLVWLEYKSGDKFE